MNHKILNIRQVKLGEGPAKICVPMVGTTSAQLEEEAKYLTTLNLDLVEWRVDCFERVEHIDEVKQNLALIRSILGEIPLIFTFRSLQEGGQRAIMPASYMRLNQEIVATGLVDIIDVELHNNEQAITSLIELAHKHGVYVIASKHDFVKTPSKDEIIAVLQHAQRLGADLPKYAVMPLNPQDVITLLDATYTMYSQYATTPIITMSMAGQGVITRIAGEVFGSALTFGIGKQASAPGQVDVNSLRSILDLLHTNLSKITP
jgi:3-dehydroquinate dehydratase-1